MRSSAALVDQTVPVGSPAEAELVKLLENTFRHVNIALVNELAMFARELGVDVWRAIDAASTKPFGYMRFTPGPGVGGHCLPIDPSYLAWRVKQHLGQTFRFVELANDVNEHMPDYVHTRITAMLNGQRQSVNGSRVLLLGLRTSGAPVTGGKALVFTLPLGWHRAAPKLFLRPQHRWRQCSTHRVSTRRLHRRRTRRGRRRGVARRPQRVRPE